MARNLLKAVFFDSSCTNCIYRDEWFASVAGANQTVTQYFIPGSISGFKTVKGEPITYIGLRSICFTGHSSLRISLSYPLFKGRAITSAPSLFGPMQNGRSSWFRAKLSGFSNRRFHQISLGAQAMSSSGLPLSYFGEKVCRVGV